MRTGLERQLTLSHLLVTALSAGILALLILAGSVVYLRTDFAARWAGENAAFFADELAYILAQGGHSRIPPELAQAFVAAQIPPADAPDAALADSLEMTPEEFADSGEWLLVFSTDGRIIASNYPGRYPPGAALPTDPPPGFNSAKIGADTPARISFQRQGSLHIGQAPVQDERGRILGWVYYRSGEESTLLLLDTARTLGWMLLGALLLAVLVSAGAGTQLARRFSRRLQRLTAASVAFASGDLDARVRPEGTDEIAQLGAQFNRMAGQIAQQMASLRQLAEDNARLAEEASALAALEERNRLARELHDAIKQQLFGLNLLAGSIRPLLATDPDAARERLQQLSRMTGEALEDMDAIIQALRPASLAEQGLAQAMTALVAGWQAQTGIPVDLQVRQAQEIPIGLEQALYRVCQEALSNVARHADAQAVAVVLAYTPDAVTLTVQDDGLGFDPAGTIRADSFGLRSMQERIEGLGGRWELRSSPGAGTTVRAWLPVSQQPVSQQPPAPAEGMKSTGAMSE